MSPADVIDVDRAGSVRAASADREIPSILEAAFLGPLRWWRFVLLATLLAGGLGVPVALRMAPWFQTTMRMVPAPSRHHDPRLPGFEPVEGATPEDVSGPGGVELGRLLSILHSRSLTDATIEKFDLMRVYGNKSIEDTRDLFWNRLAAVTLVPKEGYVELTVEDRQPIRAAGIANYMADGANEIVRRISTGAATAERTFLEHRLDEARVAMEATAQKYRDFQLANKVVDIDVQADGVMATLLRLKGQLIEGELERDRLAAFASRHEPAAIAARRHVSAVRSEIDHLENASSSGAPDFLTRLSSVPGLRREGEQLSRDARQKTSVYELLLREYELARLAEVRNTRSFEILDAAVVPTRKSRPSRSMVVLGFLLFGFVLSSGIAAVSGAFPVLRERLA